MKKTLGVCALALVFVACGDDSAKLYNTWNLVSLSDGGNPIDTSHSDRRVSITIDKDKFNGYSGCNSFFGSYKTNGDQFQSANSGMTRMLCEPKSMEIEESLIKLFSDNSVHFVLQEGKLVFEKDGENGGVKAIFEAQSK